MAALRSKRFEQGSVAITENKVGFKLGLHGLPGTNVWCSVVQCGAAWCSVVQRGAAWCSVVQCGAVWCSVVQCGAVWCSVVQCGAV